MYRIQKRYNIEHPHTALQFHELQEYVDRLFSKYASSASVIGARWGRRGQNNVVATLFSRHLSQRNQETL